MKWIETRIIFEHQDKDLAVDLISDIFYDFGLQGVVVEDPRIEPQEGWPADTSGRPDYYTVIGYFPADDRIEKRCGILERKLGSIKEKLGLIYTITYKELDEEDWAHSWKEYFHPLKIGRNLVVKPTWRDYRAKPGEAVIELDPGMAFGTGTHPTTAMCTAMIERYFKKGNSFLDVGTGSGILLIAAAKLGADKIYGIDNDPTALTVAAGNLKLNHLEALQIGLICTDLLIGIRDRFDIIVANILSHIILDLLKDIRRVLTSGGIFVCSGIVDTNEKQVVDAMEDTGFTILEINSKNEWVAIAGQLMDERKGQRA
jgi:ribosomal protein L11 methyltransferase